MAPNSSAAQQVSSESESGAQTSSGYSTWLKWKLAGMGISFIFIVVFVAIKYGSGTTKKIDQQLSWTWTTPKWSAEMHIRTTEAPKTTTESPAAVVFDVSVDPCVDLSRYVCPQRYESEKEGDSRGKRANAEKEKRTHSPLAIGKRAHLRREKTAELDPQQQRPKRSSWEAEEETQTEQLLANFRKWCLQQHQSVWYEMTPDAEENAFMQGKLAELFEKVGGVRYLDADSAAPFNGPNSSFRADLWHTVGRIEAQFQFTVGPFYYGVMEDAERQTQILSIFQTGYTIPQEYFARSEYTLRREIYHESWRLSTARILTNLKTFFEERPETFDDIVEDYLEQFEEFGAILEPKSSNGPQKLTVALKTSAGRRARQRFTLGSLALKFPHIDWAAYFRGIGLPNLDGDHPIYVDQPEHLERLDAMLARTGFHGLWRLRNYLLTNLFESLLYSLRFQTKCEQHLNTYMPHAKGFDYIKSFEAEERNNTMRIVGEMARNVLDAYRQAINESTRLSEHSKAGAMAKLNGLTLNLGWPQWYNLDRPDSRAIDHFHARQLASVARLRPNFTDNEGDHLYEFDANQVQLWKLLLALSSAQRQSDLDLIGRPNNPKMGMAPNILNAHFNGATNEMNFAFAYIRQEASACHSLGDMYGRVGSIIAHEIGHSFDPKNLLHGPNGTWTDWVDEQTAREYERVQMCQIGSYSSGCCPKQAKAPTFHRQCENGNLTQVEDFADISGLAIAYRAFESELGRHNHTQSEQRALRRDYWLSYALQNCEGRPGNEEMEKLFLSEAHSLLECRINQVVQNVPQFGRDFNCPKKKADAEICNFWSKLDEN